MNASPGIESIRHAVESSDGFVMVHSAAPISPTIAAVIVGVVMLTSFLVGFDFAFRRQRRKG